MSTPPDPRAHEHDHRLGHTAPWWIPKFLITPSIRLYYLRAVVALSAILIWYSVSIYLVEGRPERVAIGVVISCLVLAHHAGTAFGPHFFPMPNIIDLALHASEAICATYLLVMILYRGHGANVDWFPRRTIVGAVAFCGFVVALLGLFALKTLDIACSPRGTIWRRANIRHSYVNANETEDLHQPPESLKYAAGALFGRKPWHEKVPGEATWIRYLRGVLTLVILVIIAVYGVYQAILKPVAEMGMVPHDEFRGLYLDVDHFSATESVVYNLIAVWKVQAPGATSLLDVANVNLFPRMGDEALNTCNKSRSGFLKGQTVSEYETVVFQCARPVPGHTLSRYHVSDLDDKQEYRRPGLQLVINFTDIISPNFPGTDGADIFDNAVQVWLSFTGNLDDATNATSPIPLLPGANLLSVVDFSVRQRLKPGSLATFGFDIYSTFITPDILYTITNPLIAVATPNISTFRVLPAIFATEWTVRQDFRNQSVLNGLSAIGGLGSFLSTLLVIVLGSTLMQTVRGKKPYTPFGLFHNTDLEQHRMQAECMKRYPGLEGEILALSQSGRKKGVVAFLLDTLIDAENLGFKEGNTNPAQGGMGDDMLAMSRNDDVEKARLSGQGSHIC